MTKQVCSILRNQDNGLIDLTDSNVHYIQTLSQLLSHVAAMNTCTVFILTVFLSDVITTITHCLMSNDDDQTSWSLLSSSPPAPDSTQQLGWQPCHWPLPAMSDSGVWHRAPAWCSFPGLSLGPRNAGEDLRTTSKKIWNSISLKVFEY